MVIMIHVFNNNINKKKEKNLIMYKIMLTLFLYIIYLCIFFFFPCNFYMFI